MAGKMRVDGPARPRDLWGDAMHDLRQPLQSLLLLTRVVAASDDTAMREKGARYMEASLLNLQAMLEMLGRLSRLQSGTLVPVPRRCDLGRVIAGLEPALAALAALAGRRLLVSAASGGAILTCDEALLGSMIRGLVGHAARYGAGDVSLASDANAGGRVICSFEIAAEAAPRRDVFIDLAAGSLTDAPAAPVPGVAFIECLAEVAGLRLRCEGGRAGGRVSLVLAAA